MANLLRYMLFSVSSACFAQILTIDSAVDQFPIMKFPPLARYSNIHGNVRLSIKLYNGHIESITPGEAHKVLSNAAIAFVRVFKFKQDINGSLTIDFNFVLSEAAEPKKNWQRFIVDPEANIITIEATRKVVIDIDYFT